MDVTVLIVTYNQKNYISESIESAIAQTRDPDQIVISDDGSQDGTQKIIKNYARRYPEKIDLVLSDENKGIPQNLNEGIRAVETDAVTFLGGDDRFRPQKIEKEAQKLMSSPNAEVVYSNFAYTNKDGETIKQWADNHPPEGSVLKACAMREWPTGALFRNPLITIDYLNEVGLFDPELMAYEDWELKIRLSADTNIQYVNEILTEYRQHESGISSRLYAKNLRDTTRYIFEKNDELLKNNLHDEDYKEVSEFMKERINYYDVLHKKQRGDYFNAIQKNTRFAIRNPDVFRNYKQQIYLFLPPAIDDIVKNIYQSIK